MDLFQKTLNKSIQFSGIGLHTGIIANVKIMPAEENTGIIFKRVDLDKDNLIRAKIENVHSAVLCTTIKNDNGIKVSTIEHLMAAFYIAGVDNALVEIDNQEVPIMDGSAKCFISEIKKAGLQNQFKKRKFLKIIKNVSYIDKNKTLKAQPSNFSFTTFFKLQYENKLIGNQENSINFLNDELEDVCNSRTFCLLEDVEKIKKAGLAKGGSLDNAVVVDKDKILNKEGLRNEKEFVNHKILDLAGDFFLTGFRMIGNISCVQGGHQLSINFLQKLLKDDSNFLIFDTVEIKDKKDKIQYSIQKLAVNA